MLRACVFCAPGLFLDSVFLEPQVTPRRLESGHWVSDAIRLLLLLGSWALDMSTYGTGLPSLSCVVTVSGAWSSTCSALPIALPKYDEEAA